MTLIIILGHIDLSVGAIVAMSGTLTVGFIVNQGLPISAAILLGILIGVVTGFVSGFVVSHFRVPAFIITMAMMNIASGIAYVYSGGQSTRITDDFFAKIGTGYLFEVIPLPVVYMVFLIAIVSFLLNKTKFGTYVYAIGGNRESARLSGVPIKRIEIYCFYPFPVFYLHLPGWCFAPECIPGSLPLGMVMNWMLLQLVFWAEHPCRAAKAVSAELFSVRWSSALFPMA